MAKKWKEKIKGMWLLQEEDTGPRKEAKNSGDAVVCSMRESCSFRWILKDTNRDQSSSLSFFFLISHYPSILFCFLFSSLYPAFSFPLCSCSSEQRNHLETTPKLDVLFVGCCHIGGSGSSSEVLFTYSCSSLCYLHVMPHLVANGPEASVYKPQKVDWSCVWGLRVLLQSTLTQT